MAKRIFLGAIIGGLFAAVDGVIVGVFAKLFFTDNETSWWVVGMLAFYFTLTGSILGAMLGAGWKSIIKQFMLVPPAETKDSFKANGPRR